MPCDIDGASVYWLGYGALWQVASDGGEPVALVEVDQAGQLVVDGEVLWFARRASNGGAVVRLAPGGESEELLTGMGEVRGLAVDDERVYAGVGLGPVALYALDKSDPATVERLSDDAGGHELAVDADYLCSWWEASSTGSPQA